jgi:Molybdopterin oxidoreductase Fe4S4 domain/Molybdopterin oxidoreductase
MRFQYASGRTPGGIANRYLSKGKRPMLSKRLREGLDAVIGPGYGELTDVLGAMRAAVRYREEPSEVWRAMFEHLIEASCLPLLADVTPIQPRWHCRRRGIEVRNGGWLMPGARTESGSRIANPNGMAAQWGRTQCPYCGVGRGLLVQIQDGQAMRVKGDPDHPANFGEICAKAVMRPRALRSSDRLLYPHLRSRRDQALTRVPWSVALKTIARAFRSIITQCGPDAVAFYGSG